MRTGEEVDVLIVGGGVAGLACAAALADTSLTIALFERDAILGGRARSWTDETTGDPVHIGPHVVTNHYPNFFALLELAGTQDGIVWQRPDVLYTLFDGTRALELPRSRLPAPLQFLRAMSADPSLRARDLASNVRATLLALSLDEERIRSLDPCAAGDVLDELGVSPAMRARYWAFASLSILNVPLEKCSAGSLLRAYAQAAGHSDSRVGFPARGLGDLFAPGVERRLAAAGHTIERGAEVRSVDPDERGFSVRLGDGREVRARTVVCAVPPADLEALTPRRRMSFGPLEPVRYASTYLWLDRKIGARPFWARATDPRDLNCDFYDFSNIYAARTDGRSLIAANAIGAEHVRDLDDDAIVRRTFEELAQNVPAARDARIVHAIVNRIPMSVVAPLPGFEARRPRAETSIPGLYLAGDWTRTHLPSSMESAAKSGFRAAELVLAREGRRTTLVRSISPPEPLARALGAVGRAFTIEPLSRSRATEG
jgi:15-cis-phytoene desaturase